MVDLPADMVGTALTPAAHHLFKVNTVDPKRLEPQMADMFHHNVAKLLFLCKCSRPDIQTSIAFLCTQVKEPNYDDYKKLAQTMKYLHGTKYLPLILEADNTDCIKWWVDGAFAVHEDMRSHAGTVMSLGKGAAFASSTHQKLNTKSSTEAELVAVDDVMPQVIWTRNFLEAQGYTVSDNIVFQDNQSMMLLEKNGKHLSSKHMHHINICYFFVTDRIQAKEVSVEHCPTGEMLGDFFTKPLQGGPFRKFRDRILNLTENDVRLYMREVMTDACSEADASHHRSVLGTNDGWNGHSTDREDPDHESPRYGRSNDEETKATG